MSVALDLTSSAFRADPYATYRRLREEAPVWHAVERGRPLWVLSRHADVVAALRHPAASVERSFQPRAVPLAPGVDAETLHPLARAMRALSRVMLFRDPPDHTRLRGLVARAFTPRRVEALEPRIRARVDALLDGPARDGGLDVIRDLAIPLPLLVIAELLGVPVDDFAALKRWSDDLASILDGTVALQVLPRATRSAVEFVDFLRVVVRERRRSPRDDLLSAMIAAQELDDHLSEDEVLGTGVLVLGAGHETTTNLIGNGVLALLDHPGEEQRLRRDPTLLASAVEECLRFDSPVQATARVLREPWALHGHRIPAGNEIGLLLGAANRDPAVFPEPDRFDVARNDGRHLSFGHGVHFCLGAGLARLEGRLALEGLLARFPRLEAVDAERVWRPGFLFRGLERLAVRA